MVHNVAAIFTRFNTGTYVHVACARYYNRNIDSTVGLPNICLLIGAVGSTITIGILALHFSTHLHALWIELGNPHGYLNSALQWSPIYGQQIKPFEYPLLTILVQLSVVLAAVLGIYFVLYPLLFRLSVHRFGFHATDALPLLLLMSFISLMLFAPIASNGDFTEYKHRHFPLLYVIAAIYTITYAWFLATNYGSNENKFQTVGIRTNDMYFYSNNRVELELKSSAPKCSSHALG